MPTTTVFKFRFKLPTIPDGLYEVRDTKARQRNVHACIGAHPLSPPPPINQYTRPHAKPTIGIYPFPFTTYAQPVKVANVGDYELRYLSIMTAESVLPQPTIQAIDGGLHAFIMRSLVRVKLTLVGTYTHHLFPCITVIHISHVRGFLCKHMAPIHLHHLSHPHAVHATGQGIKRFYQQKRGVEWDGWVEVRVALNEQKVRLCRAESYCVCVFI